MPRIVVTAEVENGATWEQNFRTHSDLFRDQTVSEAIQFAVQGNDVTITFEPSDLDKWTEIMESDRTAQAMAQDGVKRETVKIVVLDKLLDV